jgi:hypothetical protein
MIDTVTILETHGNLVAAKRVRLRPGQDPEIVGYDSPKHFTVHERQVDSIISAAELLSKVEGQSKFMMVRGRVRDGVDRNNTRRTYVNGGDEEPCFDAAAHNLMMLDFDKIDCPAGLDPLAPAVAVRCAVALLPFEFHGVTCWWQFTSSAGVRPGIRLRLGYWGSRPTTDQELKNWLPAILDHSVFAPVQPIYIANPIFEEGVDPVPVRSGVICGDRDEVAIPDRIERESDDDGLGYAGYRAQIGDHPGGKGFNIPIGKAIAAWFGKHGAKKPTGWLRTDLERAIRAADATRHSDADIEEKIASLDRRIEWTREREAQKPPKQSQGEAVAAIADGASLFHTPEGDAFVDLDVHGHRETYPVRSKAFKQWLSFEFYRAHGKPPAGDAVEQSLTLTEGRARFDAPEREAYVRVARLDGKIYLDLADDAWRAVEVDANGWRVVDRPPVRFRRTAGMLPLPEPVRGGDIDALRPFVNVDDDGFVLTVAWQLTALGGIGPYPLLVIYGVHGSAKTSTGRFCRRVIDPNTLLSRGPPRSDRDLYVAAFNSHGVHFENISKLPDWLSDTLCRLATGGGFATRQLYENTDEVLFRGMRPVILDGIENFVERADLADRAIKLSLDKVPEESRRGEAELNRDFETAHPTILGALLDAVSYGLAELPDMKLATLPRMADFALWIAACEGALWREGEFRQIYDENRVSMLVDTIEGDVVADAVREMMSDQPWTGTASNLLTCLESNLDLKVTLRPEWPKNGRALSARLRRIKDGLAKVGIDMMQEEHGDRLITLLPRPAAQAAQKTS